MLHAMIMAGGGGTRFWPRSRAGGPSSSSPSPATARCCKARSTASRRRCRRNGPGCSPAGAPSTRPPQQLPELPRRPHRRRAGRPRHRRVRRPGGGAHRQGDPDATIIVMPADHVIEPSRSSAAPLTPPSNSPRTSRISSAHLRHPADVPGHRLRLHPVAANRSARGRV